MGVLLGLLPDPAQVFWGGVREASEHVIGLIPGCDDANHDFRKDWEREWVHVP